MNVAYMDKIANENSGTDYLLVAVDVLSRGFNHFRTELQQLWKMLFWKISMTHFLFQLKYG